LAGAVISSLTDESLDSASTVESIS